MQASVVGLAWLALAVLAFHVGIKLRDQASARHCLLAALLAAGVVSAGAGLLQFFGLADPLWPWIPETSRGRAFGSFHQPNLYASFLALCMVCALWLLHERRISTGMAFFLTAVLQAGIAASTSRIGLLASVVGAILVAAWVPWTRAKDRWLAAGQLGLLFIAVLALPWLGELHGFSTRHMGARIAGVATDSRWQLWQDSWRLVMQRPWWGWGWGEYAWAHHAVPMAERFGANQVVDNAHNLPLHLAVELGLPVALFFALGSTWWLARRWPIADAPQRFALVLLGLLALHSLVEFPLWYAGFFFIAGLAAGLLSRNDRPWRFGAAGFTVAACMLLGASAIAARQYAAVAAVHETPADRTDLRSRAIDRAAFAWLFAGDLDFARLVQMHALDAPARERFMLAARLVHYTPEPFVTETLIRSANTLGSQELARWHLQRYCETFPRRYSRSEFADRAQPSTEACGDLR